MTISALTADIRNKLEKLTLKGKLKDEYERNAEIRFALDHLCVQSISNVLNRKLDGVNPKQRTDADIAREKPFRLLSDKEIDAYSCEKTLRDGFAHSPIPSVPFATLEPYQRMRFFETIFPREDIGVEMLKLTPLQQVHKNHMKKVYDGGMSWDELNGLVNHHKDLKHLSAAFNLANRLEAFVRGEAATDYLKEMYDEAAKVALTMDATKYRVLRRVIPGKSGREGDKDEIGADKLRQFAAHKISKEEDLLLGGIELDKRLTKKLLDVLSAYQFIMQVISFEQSEGGDSAAGQAGAYPAYATRFREEIDIVIGKIVEHGGERHTMTERGKMKKQLLGWLENYENFSRGLTQHAKTELEAVEQGVRPGALPPAVDLWAF